MDYDKLYSLVDEASLVSDSLVEYNGIEFIIKYFDRCVESAPSAIASVQPEEIERIIEGTIIYKKPQKCLVLIANGQAENERRLCLLPEIVEICLMQYHDYKRESAHEIALKHEEKYTQRKLTNAKI